MVNSGLLSLNLLAHFNWFSPYQSVLHKFTEIQSRFYSRPNFFLNRKSQLQLDESLSDFCADNVRKVR